MHLPREPEVLGPEQRVSVPQAAKLIGASERSLRRSIQNVRSGEVPVRTANAWQLLVAEAFVKNERDRVDMTVGGVYRAIGKLPPAGPVSIEKIADPPRKPKQERSRLTDVTEDLTSAVSASEASVDERKSVREKLVALKSRPGRPAWRQIAAVVEWLREAGECPMEVFKGVSLSKLTRENIPRFATLADFLAGGNHDDRWVFVFRNAESRPRDLFSADNNEIRFGLVVSLSMAEYSRLLLESIEREREDSRARREAEEIRAVTRLPRKRR